MHSERNSQANQDYEIFKSQYKRVIRNSEKAISEESNGNKTEAYVLYKKIIIDLENVMAINISGSDNTIRQDVRYKKERLKWLRNNIYVCIERLGNAESGALTLVYFIKSGCQYNTIDNLGNVKSSVPGSIEIYKFSKNKDPLRGILILSDWILHLKSDETPVLLTPRGALLFLDVDKNCKVAVTLPYDVQQDEYNRFIEILSTLSLLVIDNHEVSTDNHKSTGDIIAQGVSKVTRVVSNGIEVGATKLSEIMNDRSKNYCQSSSVTCEEVSVNPNLKIGLEYARKGSHCLVEISGKAFGLLIKSTQYLASKAAPHIKSAADNVIPSEWKKTGENGEKSTVDQIAVVTGATVDGFLQLCSSLREGAVIFGRSFARDTSNIMTHRYGDKVGRSTENALYSVGNLGMTAFTAMSFTKKGIIKTAAEVTGRSIVAEYNKEPGTKTIDSIQIDKTR